MNFKLTTPFMEAFEELDKLNEDAKSDASKKFWASAKMNQLDEVSFHAAFDDELKELGLMDMFTAEGALVNKGVYGRIKAAKEANPDSWAVRALSKLWALRYVDNIKFASELEADNAAADAARLRAEQKRQEEETARAAKEAKFKEYQKLLNTYISKIDPTLVAAYEEVAGVSAAEGVYLKDEGEVPAKTWRDTPTTKYGIYFKGWNRYYPVTEAKFIDEAAILKLLAQGFTAAAEGIRINNVTNKFKDIDIFKANKYATVILLGRSGTTYEVVHNSFTNAFQVGINGGDLGPADVVTEPYEVIYARTSWSDGNNSTRRDSRSATYYSWNSQYVDKLNGKIPTEFGSTSDYLGSYSDTKMVSNPSSSYYSHEEGIDSWAIIDRLDAATD